AASQLHCRPATSGARSDWTVIRWWANGLRRSRMNGTFWVSENLIARSAAVSGPHRHRRPARAAPWLRSEGAWHAGDPGIPVDAVLHGFGSRARAGSGLSRARSRELRRSARRGGTLRLARTVRKGAVGRE